MPRNPATGVVRPTISAPRGITGLLAFAALVVVALGLREFGESLGPILLALILMIVVDPIRGGLIARGAPTWLALSSVLCVAFGILLAFTAAIVWAMTRLADYLAAADYETRLTELQGDTERWLLGQGVSRETIDRGLDSIDPESVTSYVLQSVTGLLGVIGLVGIVIVAVILIALDATGFHRTLLGPVRAERPAVAAALGGFASGTRRYFAVYTLFGLVVASIQVAFMWAVGVPLALVWGLLSLLASYIPNIGIILATVPPVVVAFLEFGWFDALVVAAGLFGINQVIDSVAKPKVVGDVVGISATLTFLSLLFWAWVFGAVGALLAVPLTLFVRALLVDANPENRWLGALVSLSEPTPAETPASKRGPSATVIPPY